MMIEDGPSDFEDRARPNELNVDCRKNCFRPMP